MNARDRVGVPALSCVAAHELEKRLLGGDERAERAAMQAAGAAIAAAVLLDFSELGDFPAQARLLVLAGKGHNGGDALIAARHILERFPKATAEVVFVFGERTLRPLAAEAWRELQQTGRARVNATKASDIGEASHSARAYELCLDGIFGFQFRPPADARVANFIATVNRLSIRLRAAVDLPSADLFSADFTYATGSVKEPVLSSDHAGRLRYLDLGFFDPPGTAVPLELAGDVPAPTSKPEAADRVLTLSVLDPLRRLRSARSDKRSYGHVFIVGGSRGFPGAVLMCASAAVRSGAGLVTVFAPESLVPSFAARLPEAIWVGWPETPSGSLALEGEHLLRERAERADALVIGPGIGREPETLALVQAVVAASGVPVVIDADALQADIVRAGAAARIVTPHAGEFKRIAGGASLRSFATDPKLTVVLKGPITRICSGGPVYHSLAGGPVLARGGSGDLLAGMIGTQLAQSPDEPLAAAARAVTWHGHAADLLARREGQVAVATTQLLEYLGPALRAP